MAGASGVVPFPEGSRAGWVQELAPGLREAPQPSWLLPWVTMLSAQAPCPVLPVCVILLVEAVSIASCRLAAVSLVLGRF